MIVQPLLPDVAPGAQSPTGADVSAFAGQLDRLAGVLQSAQSSEDRFASGTGTLQAAVYDRARADVALSIASAAATRAAQALQSILNMAV